VEGGVAGVAVDHLVPVVALRAEADLAVGLKQALHLLQLGRPPLLSLLLLQRELLYHHHLHRVIQHPFCLVRVPPLEVKQDFRHAELFLYLGDLELLNRSGGLTIPPDAFEHPAPIVEVPLIQR
jgi:hypothetical protein